MKKLFKLTLLLRGGAQMLSRARARPHAYHPLQRRPSMAERLLRKLTSRMGR